MKKYILILIVIVVVGCKDKDSNFVCGVPDPAELPWMKTKIDELQGNPLRQYFRIEQAVYETQTVFFVNSCCPMCLILPVVYNCSGEVIEDADFAKVQSTGIVWQPSDFSCQMQ